VAYITIIIIVVLAYVSVYNCLVYASKTTTTEMTVIHYLTFANKLIAYLTSNFYYSGKNDNIFLDNERKHKFSSHKYKQHLHSLYFTHVLQTFSYYLQNISYI